MSNDPVFYVGAYRKVRRTRVLSLDGAGLYGLTEALFLKELCRRNDRFLTEGNISLFAGCSAGAVNALLMAKYDRPRDAVMSGELEAFWEGVGVWRNSNPVDAMYSYVGLTPWFGTRDFLDHLRNYFGDKTLGDLEQNVAITTYAWSGSLDLPRHGDPGLPSLPDTVQFGVQATQVMARLAKNAASHTHRLLTEGFQHPWVQTVSGLSGVARPSSVPYPDPDPLQEAKYQQGSKYGVITDGYRHWQPLVLMSVGLPRRTPRYPDRDVPHSSVHPRHSDFLEEFRSMDDLRLVDVAYAATAPPGFRAVRYGLGDGASFSANPAPIAYARLQQYLTHRFFPGEEEGGHAHRLLQGGAVGDGLLRATPMLSVGDGSAMPFQFPSHSAAGMASSMLPRGVSAGCRGVHPHSCAIRALR